MRSDLLTADGLTKRYGRFTAIEDVSFTLRAGEVLGLVGESGSGKSTTVRCLVGLTKPDAGTVSYDGEPLQGRAAWHRFRREAQMVFQDPYASLNPRMTVAEIVGEGLRVHGIERTAAGRRARVTTLLGQVGLDAGDLDRYPRSFSGGQRQRIAIARAIAVEPRVLICDEPVSALDVSVQAQVVNVLRDMGRELGLSILFIAHDLAVVRYLCDRLVVLDQGRIAEQGTREQIYDNPQAPYTRSLLAAVPIPDPAAERERRHRQKESAR
ncbi:ABC-type oligopeptide transport system ATPase subunit [Actinoplanes lutulentus]|uniref:Oligopeptide transport system ATP-binding protein n=1 Tax=Actinoplanes lutulentus TaxID=1287878 RepID=A0A327ZCN8_9ACTN|nr:ATP-binding cassette domain-containing protein [Actinoplanes lutulentus]MBB2947221.1 ABC-type oligopeptide transport system ATPase subunit [Actinoplanes lutulentus]RAK36496.1 oligopeptide transport system ATP-binding protein [Actinoplanes lutulentus]